MSISDTKSAEDKSSCKSSAFFELIDNNFNEIRDNIHSLQKAVSGLREQVAALSVEHEEDAAELKRRLWQLQWISKERA